MNQGELDENNNFHVRDVAIIQVLQHFSLQAC